jgi:hypothetical protein
MKNGKRTKGLIIVIIGLFIAVNFLTNSTYANSNLNKTIIVPDDYPTIQKEINNANYSDIIDMRNNEYFENILIDKKINLIGDKKIDFLFLQKLMEEKPWFKSIIEKMDNVSSILRKFEKIIDEVNKPIYLGEVYIEIDRAGKLFVEFNLTNPIEHTLTADKFGIIRGLTKLNYTLYNFGKSPSNIFFKENVIMGAKTVGLENKFIPIDEEIVKGEFDCTLLYHPEDVFNSVDVKITIYKFRPYNSLSGNTVISMIHNGIPGFELVFVILAISLIVFMMRRKQRT